MGSGPYVSLTIAEDEIFEKDEYFSIHMMSEMKVIVTAPYKNVTIEDNEGGWETFSLTYCLWFERASCYIFLLLCAVVYVAFTEAAYSVDEDAGMLTVMVEVTGVVDPTGAEIWLTFSSSSVEATGSGVSLVTHLATCWSLGHGVTPL